MERRPWQLGLIAARSACIFILISMCSPTSDTNKGAEQNAAPTPIMEELIPEGLIVHRGLFSNDMDEFYIVTSSKSFEGFDIKVSKKQNGEWSDVQDAWFNSEYDDHGLSFSPDGNQLIFSSTRPTNVEGVANTWHLWRSTKTSEGWSEPEFINIPDLQDKLVSHPTLAPDGTLYFHVSNLDYSEMSIHFSKLEEGAYRKTEKLDFAEIDSDTCTPYITSDGKYLLFATVEETLPLFVAKLTDSGRSSPIKLPAQINRSSQANPFITENNEFLLFASIREDGIWQIERVSTASFLK